MMKYNHTIAYSFNEVLNLEKDGFELVTAIHCQDNSTTFYLKKIIDESRPSEWQLCPKCNGTGRILTDATSSSVHMVCDCCNGAKMLVKPLINPA